VPKDHSQDYSDTNSWSNVAWQYTLDLELIVVVNC
jgi:hypothetical protein